MKENMQICTACKKYIGKHGVGRRHQHSWCKKLVKKLTQTANYKVEERSELQQSENRG